MGLERKIERFEVAYKRLKRDYYVIHVLFVLNMIVFCCQIYFLYKY